MARGRDKARKWADPESPPPSLGGQAVAWMEQYLVHGPGDAQGKPYRLHADLKLLWWMALELDRKTGAKTWAEVVNVGPKGIAKSETLAAGCCLDALGPCVFDGWDAQGNPVGRPRESSEVHVYANDEDQAGNTFTVAAMMLGPETCSAELLADYGPVDIGKHEESSSRIILPDHRGVIEVKTARARSKQGGKTTMVAIEEPHEWKLPEMHKLYATKVKDATKRADTLVMHATNMFGVGEGSVLEAIYGDLPTPGLLWFGRTPPDGLVPDDVELRDLPERVLMEALRAVYGSAKFVPLRQIAGRIRRRSMSDAESRRFYLNQPHALDGGSWIDEQLWADRVTARRPAPLETVGLGWYGVDGITALCASTTSDRLTWPLRVWDVQPSPSEADEAIEDAWATLRPQRLLVNPWGFKPELERWTARYGDKVVKSWPVREGLRMAAMVDLFESSVQTGQVCHTGDATLTAHLSGCTVRELKTGRQIFARSDARPIAVAVAAVMAVEAAFQAVRVGAPPPPKPVFAY